jgi:hypothetical protein
LAISTKNLAIIGYDQRSVINDWSPSLALARKTKSHLSIKPSSRLPACKAINLLPFHEGIFGASEPSTGNQPHVVSGMILFFQLEKARRRPLYSPDNLIKITCKAAGISYSSVYRVVNGESPSESNRPKERKPSSRNFLIFRR